MRLLLIYFLFLFLLFMIIFFITFTGKIKYKDIMKMDSQQAFEKLHTIIPSCPEVVYHISNLCDLQGNFQHATKWFSILSSKVSTDPTILSRLGQLYNREQDEAQAFHYHLESYRNYPVNLDVISWLGVWYVKGELYEKAIHFFERAAQIQPKEVKWRLMITSCCRRMGAYAKAHELYQKIHHIELNHLLWHTFYKLK